MTDRAEDYGQLAGAVALLEDEGVEVVDADARQVSVGGVFGTLAQAMGQPSTETLLELTLRPTPDLGDEAPYPDPPSAADLQDDVDESLILARVLLSIYGRNPQAPPEDMDAGVLLEKLDGGTWFDKETIADAVAECGWFGTCSAEWAEPAYWGGEE